MEMQSLKTIVEPLSDKSLDWFVNVAAVSMILYEVKRPELVNITQLYALANQGKTDGTAFVTRIGKEYTGAIGAILTPNLFNPKLSTLMEVFWYVLPEYRNTRAGLLLLRQLEKCGQEKADETNMCLLVDSPVSIESLEKRGFEMKEIAFRKGK